MALHDNPFLYDIEDEDGARKPREAENPFLSEDEDEDINEIEMLKDNISKRKNRKTLGDLKFPEEETESNTDNTRFNEPYESTPTTDTTPDDTSQDNDESIDDIFGNDNPFETLSETEVQQEDTTDGLEDFGEDPFAEPESNIYDYSSDTSEVNELEPTGHDDEALGQSTFSGFSVNKILETAIREGNISDVHIHTNQGVSFTRLGEIEHRPEFGVPEGRITRKVQRYLISHLLDQDFVREKDLDTSYVLREGVYKGSRFRLNLALHFEEVAMTFRIISDEIPKTETLEVEQELKDWFSLPSGLILINGPTGSGKSTTMASLMREVQLTKPKKIITVEKPIEYVYPNDGKGLVLQREVGKDTRSFGNGLSAAMRQAPKVILIGEVRNQDELSELLRAAETGHLAISTMHTNSVPTAINRIKSMFEGEEQKRVLLTLSDTIQGIMNQSLPKTVDGKGRFAVREILRVTPEIRNLIAEGNVLGIRAYQQKHKITMEHKLAEAVWQGRCTLEVGREQAVTPEDFDQYLSDLQEEKGPGRVTREDMY